MGILSAFRPLAAAALVFIASTHMATADVVAMDSFSVTGLPGHNFFTDPLNLSGTVSGSGAFSGVSLTATPSTKVNYNVTGSFSESGGTATLDTANGVRQASSPPFDPLDQQVIATYAGGFTPSSAFGVTGIFYLSVPTTVGALYGIELVDLNAGHNGDVIAMRIVETATGPQIELVNVDHFDNTLTVIESTALVTTHDEIEFNLVKGANSNAVSGSFAYIDGSVLGSLMPFVDTTNLANDGATAVTFAFNALAPVPEPGSLALFASGLAALGLVRKRKKS
jgi:hypothetical protein